MESEPRARELMKKDFGSIHLEATVHEAVEILYKMAQESEARKIAGAGALVVVDGEGKFIGLITMLDILKGIEPPFLREAEHLAGLTWDGLFGDLVRSANNRKVSEAMSSVDDIVTISPEDRLMKAVELMVKKRLRRLPVVEDDKVIGMVRLYDVFHEVASEIMKQSGSLDY